MCNGDCDQGDSCDCGPPNALVTAIATIVWIASVGTLCWAARAAFTA